MIPKPFKYLLFFFACACLICPAYPQTEARLEQSYLDVVSSPEWKDFTEEAGKNFYRPLLPNELDSVCKKTVLEKNSLPSDKLVVACISAALESLSINSSYISPEEIQKREEQQKNRFVGIGIEMGLEDGYLKVIAPIEGGPAHLAGLKPGDLILRVDGSILKGRSLDDIVKMMRGSANTNMHLQVARRNADTPLEFNITRRPISIRSVKQKLLDSGVAYIRIIQFNDRTRAEFFSGIAQLEQDNKEPLKSLVLDLRNNPGGTLPAVLGIAAAFLPEDAIIIDTRGRQPTTNRLYRALPADYTTWNAPVPERTTLTNLRSVPLVILVNEKTASGSEALVAALRDYHRASSIGKRTFGSAEIRTFVKLMNGAGMWIQTSAMYSPEGQTWEGQGIAPDVQDETPAGPVFGVLPDDKLLTKALEYLKEAASIKNK